MIKSKMQKKHRQRQKLDIMYDLRKKEKVKLES
jgi:hypothetical protein